MGNLKSLPYSEIESLIDEWILSERNRMILKRKLLDGVTFEALEGEFNISARQLKTIVAKNTQILEEHIQVKNRFTKLA